MKAGLLFHASARLRRVAPLVAILALVAGAGWLVGGRNSFPLPGASKVATIPRPQVRHNSAQLLGNFGRLPLSFEANHGQTDSRVKFLGRGPGYTIFLTPTETVLALQGGSRKSGVRSQETPAGRNSKLETGNSKPETGNSSLATRLSSLQPQASPPATLRLTLLGANTNPEIRGLHELSAKSNYFLGNDPHAWRTQIPNYAQVRYASVYPGIDLILYGNQRELENDFVVAPGAHPQAITISISAQGTARTAVPLRIDRQGDLIIAAGGSEVRLRKPLAYQVPTHRGLAATNGAPAKHFVDARYVLKSRNEVGLAMAAYDPSRPLVIDPVLSYSTYLGGSADDAAYAIAVDSSGSAYVTGSTGSSNFPTTTSPLQGANVAPPDAFVTKLKPDGTGLVYSTYLGGGGFDRGTGIAIDASGDAFVAGYTSSAGFPTTSSAFQKTYGGGFADAFVAELKPDGSALIYSTYVGGAGADYALALALDSAGSAYITGSTDSAAFPTVSPFQSAGRGNTDAFVAKLKPDGSGLVYSTYLGGGNADAGQGIAADSSGNAYVTGYTHSTNFPTASPWQAASGGGSDAFVAEFNPAGSALIYSTYFGGSGADRGFGIAVDSAGSAYITGDTTSTDLPTTTGALATSNHGNTEAFVAKLNAAGSGLAYSTYLGGADIEQGVGIAVDSARNAYVTGSTRSADFPTASAFQATAGGGTCDTNPCFDAFVTVLDPTGATLIYSSFLGGIGADYGQAIAVDASGNAYVVGITASNNFPVTLGVAQPAFGGGSGGDAFVAKVSPANAPSVVLFPQKLTFANQAMGTTSAAQTVTLTNSGSAPLNITSIVASSNFGVTDDCGSSLAPGGTSCTLNVTYSPSAVQSDTGSVTITDAAAGSPQTIALTGTGVTPTPAVTLSVTSIDFGDQTVSTTSAAKVVTVTNSGSAALNITAVTISGEFTETDNCLNATLAVNASCTANVIFAPTGSGAQTGTLTFTDNASGSPQSVTLTGNGVAEFTLSSSPSSVTLSRGTDSSTFTISAATQTTFSGSLTLSCTGDTNIACAFSPASITPGQTSTLTVTKLSTLAYNTVNFSVSATTGTGSTAQTGTVSIVILLGDFSMTATPPLNSVAAGDKITYTVTLSPANGFNGQVAMSCSSLPNAATCSFDQASPTLNGTSNTTVTVTVQTTTHSLGVGRWQRPTPPPGMPGRARLPWLVWLLALLALGAFAAARGRGRLAWVGRAVPLASLLLAAALSAGCNNYYYSPISGVAPKGTPTGSYTLIITGTFTPQSGTAVVHSTLVNLTVS